MEEKKTSPYIRLWNMGKEEHGKLLLAIILAVIGVTSSMAAYYSAAKMIVALLNGNENFNFYLNWCLIFRLCDQSNILCCCFIMFTSGNFFNYEKYSYRIYA